MGVDTVVRLCVLKLRDCIQGNWELARFLRVAHTVKFLSKPVNVLLGHFTLHSQFTVLVPLDLVALRVKMEVIISVPNLPHTTALGLA